MDGLPVHRPARQTQRRQRTDDPPARGAGPGRRKGQIASPVRLAPLLRVLPWGGKAKLSAGALRSLHKGIEAWSRRDGRCRVDAVKTLITDEMRAIVGVVMEEETSYPIAASDIRRWALAVYYPEVPPPEFWDDEDPVTVAAGGIVAPDEFNPLAWIAKDPKPAVRDAGARAPRVGAFETRLGVEAPAFRAVLQGEIRARYGEAQMRPGDVVHAATSITEYSEREGRMGLQLYTTLSEALTNQNGAWVKTVDTVFVRY